MEQWQWTKERQVAAQLVAEGGKSIAEIAQRVNVKPYTISKWSKRPEFIEKVDQIRTESAEALKRAGLRVRENRLQTLNDVFDRIYKVIKGREIFGELIPGGESGLLVRRVRHLGEEYVFDAALIRELREAMKHAAIEVGEWIEKQQIDAGDSKPLPIDIKLTIDKVYGETEPEKTESQPTSIKE